MRRVVASVLLGTFVLFALPGMAEVVENLVHLAETGHTAHAVEADDHHGDADDEHGCSGAYHLCSCCTNLPVAAALTFVAPCAAIRATGLDGGGGADRFRPGFARGVDRPPTA